MVLQPCAPTVSGTTANIRQLVLHVQAAVEVKHLNNNKKGNAFLVSLTAFP